MQESRLQQAYIIFSRTRVALSVKLRGISFKVFLEWLTTVEISRLTTQSQLRKFSYP